LAVARGEPDYHDDEFEQPGYDDAEFEKPD
jgi:hypothetical protein